MTDYIDLKLPTRRPKPEGYFGPINCATCGKFVSPKNVKDLINRDMYGSFLDADPYCPKCWKEMFP